MLTREQIKTAWGGKKVPAVSVRNETFDSLKMANEAGGSLVIPTPQIHLNTSGFIDHNYTRNQALSNTDIYSNMQGGLHLSWAGADREFLNHDPHYFLFKRHSTNKVKRCAGNGHKIKQTIASKMVHVGNNDGSMFANFSNGNGGAYQTEFAISENAGAKTRIYIDLKKAFGLGRLDNYYNNVNADGRINGIRYYLVVTALTEAYDAGAVNDYVDGIENFPIISRDFDNLPFALSYQTAERGEDTSVTYLEAMKESLEARGVTCHIVVDPRLSNVFPRTEYEMFSGRIGIGLKMKIAGMRNTNKRCYFQFAIVCRDPNNPDKWLMGGMSQTLVIEPQYAYFNVFETLFKGDYLLWDGNNWQKDLSTQGDSTINCKVYYGWRASINGHHTKMGSSGSGAA